MAELLFDTKPGLVRIAQLTSGSAPALISVIPTRSGHGGDLATYNSVIIQSIGLSQEVHAQFMSSLQKVVYIYCFGDKPGQIIVSGLAFNDYCIGPNENPAQMVGPNTLMGYYDSNRAVEEENIIKVLIGRESFQGYLISMNMQTANIEQRTFQFSLTIWTVPKQVGPIAKGD